MALFRFMLATDRFDESCRFYADIMHLTLVFEWDDDGRGAIFQAPGAQLEIFESDGSPSEGRPHRPASVPRPGSTAVAWQVDDLDAEATALVGRGATLVAEPELRPWGMKMLTVRAPDGTLLSLFELVD